MGSFSILNNLSSLNGAVNLSNTQSSQAKSLAQLSSGLRIVHAGDDAAGLSVANKFRSDTVGLNQGIRNANDGVNALQVVDGGLQQISSLLDRARTLATQSASDTFSGDRSTLNNEFQKVLSEIDRQASAVGLGNGAGFNNTSNNIAKNVFIGGGQSAANAGSSSNDNEVNVDLSGAANLVDATSLGLSNSSNGVAGGSALTVSSALGAGASLTISLTGSSASSFTVDLSTAASNNDVISKINQAAGGFVTASTNAAGDLTLSSSQSFTALASNAATTTALGISHSAAVASSATSSNSDILSSGNAQAALAAIASANTALGKVIGVVGAGENRLQQAINLANTEVVNFTSSESQIRDANIAQTASENTRFSVLTQAGVAALAQSNQSSQAILALLR